MINPLLDVSIESRIFLMAIVAVGILGTLWFQSRKDTSLRRRFVALFDQNDLRMDPYTVDTVFKVVEIVGDNARVVPVWRAGKPIKDGAEYTYASGNLAPFDYDRFISAP